MSSKSIIYYSTNYTLAYTNRHSAGVTAVWTSRDTIICLQPI